MAANILTTIEAATAARVDACAQKLSLEELRELCQDPAGVQTHTSTAGFPCAPRESNLFAKALAKPGMSFICEVKKASPSKGLISPDFPYQEIAAQYVAAGADCMSCLTEPQWFLGSDAIFMDIRQRVDIPMIRKDFVVGPTYRRADFDPAEYQIRQAKLMGADAMLLICALMDTPALEQHLRLCHDLGLSALVEAHDETEARMAVSAGAELIGVNNRDLKDFSVDFSNASRMRRLIPDGRTYVAESGVKSVEDVAALYQMGADAVLMGEVLMRADDPARLIATMKEACR